MTARLKVRPHRAARPTPQSRRRSSHPRRNRRVVHRADTTDSPSRRSRNRPAWRSRPSTGATPTRPTSCSPPSTAPPTVRAPHPTRDRWGTTCIVIAQHLHRVFDHQPMPARHCRPPSRPWLAIPALAQAHQAFLSRRRQAALTAVERGIARGDDGHARRSRSARRHGGGADLLSDLRSPHRGRRSHPPYASWMQRWRPIE